MGYSLLWESIVYLYWRKKRKPFILAETCEASDRNVCDLSFTHYYQPLLFKSPNCWDQKEYMRGGKISRTFFVTNYKYAWYVPIGSFLFFFSGKAWNFEHVTNMKCSCALGKKLSGFSNMRRNKMTLPVTPNSGYFTLRKFVVKLSYSLLARISD